MDNKGQSIMSEHVMIFFVVIAALSAMTLFVQRAFEARVHDAHTYLIKQVNSACDANCQMAANGIGYEYEPYYTRTLSFVAQNSEDMSTIQKGHEASFTSVYGRSYHQKTSATVNSSQLPPECAGSKPPAYCTKM
ncbi:MAG: hypothetical protein HQL13_04595 [Candidatus Omnitrophica bacterium]|nr:hypothetical protein [Candidatus Omnitrophota bacterium]